MITFSPMKFWKLFPGFIFWQAGILGVIYSHNKYAYIHIYMFMQHHNDTIIKTDACRKTQEDLFTNIFTSPFICKVSKRLCGDLLWEGAGDQT